MNEGIYSPEKNTKDELFAFALALLSYLPLTTLFNMVRVGVAGLLFFARPRHEITDPRVGSVAKRMVVSPLLSVLFVIIMEGSFSSALVTHELMRMLFCALLILTVSSLQVSFRCIYNICLIVFLPNFAIQVAQYLHIGSISSFIRSHYLTTEAQSHLDLANELGRGFRAGSIFINPNVYMVIPLIALVIFLHKDKIQSSVLNYLFIGCTAISCYFTGSRTATVVFIVIIGLYFFRYAQGSNKAVLILFALISIALVGRETIIESRSFALSSNDMDSFTVKLNGFVWYWNSTVNNPLYWITGSIGSNTVTSIDCEWGHIYTWFGLFGIIWYVKYLKITFTNNSHISFFSKPIAYVAALVAITASVLLCMPVFSFACVIMFSKIVE